MKTTAFRVGLLAASIVAAMPLAVSAQSTTGTIFGQAPTVNHGVVVIENQSGLRRELPVGAAGRYQSPQLPVGTYRVTLISDGKVVEEKNDVTLKVGSNIEVSFGNAGRSVQNLQGVEVSASTSPPIDVSSVDSRTVITREQLTKLPLGYSSEAIALLAPGVAGNSGGFQSATGNSLVVFGGSSASENAYYINGFNTTDPLQGLGGLTMPYGAIEQQETYTGGYSAKYGRSDGGVINVIGRRGTNQWHFGAQVLWEPAFLRSKKDDILYANGLPSSPVAGDLYEPDSKDSYWGSRVSAYAGGPLIKDKLYAFVAVEKERFEGQNVHSVQSNTSYTDYRQTEPRWYAKVDWNINDSNILELTGVSDKLFSKGKIYQYNYDTLSRGARAGSSDNTKDGGDLYVAKYTSYITDNLNLSVMYGKMHTRAYDSPSGYDPELVYITGITGQNPALNGGMPIGNAQTTQSISDPDQGNKSTDFRFDLSYTLGSHTFSVGVDNVNSKAINQGFKTSGPGYYWYYGLSDPNLPLETGTGVPGTGGFPNGAEGFYVDKHVDEQLLTIRSTQRAQFVEDRWQVNDNLLVSMGLRNDQFTNYNSDGDVFIRQTKPQWSPRLGFSWNVYGDSTFKIYGNAGRYYLGLPLNPGINSAGAIIQTRQYYTYSGIGADGVPTGLTPVGGTVASNNLFGQLPDPKTVTAKNLVAEHQDEFIVGFTQQFRQDWVYGLKLTERVLKNAIDDYCDIGRVADKAASLGYNIDNTNSCYLINPGKGNTFVLRDTSGRYVDVPLAYDEFGWDHRLTRKYASAELVLEHPFKDRWYGMVSYVFSKSWGNTEGQLRSDIHQSYTSTTQDWDYPSIMEHTYGVQNNNHRHQLKVYGYYQFNPEWMVSGNLRLISGAPKGCLSYFGPDQTDPAAYGGIYHFCKGKPAPPGSNGNLPWFRQLDLGVHYRPAVADGKLALNVDVFNVFNEKVPTSIEVYSQDSPNVPNANYGQAIDAQAPRYVRFSVNYDY
ncbi:MAG: TonB-dependent receptor [Rhodanobacter sp.]